MNFGIERYNQLQHRNHEDCPFLASQDDIEVMCVTHSLTVRTDLTDVTLVSDDTYRDEEDEEDAEDEKDEEENLSSDKIRLVIKLI